MQDSVYDMQDTEHDMQDIVYDMQDTVYDMQDTEHDMQDTVYDMQDTVHVLSQLPRRKASLFRYFTASMCSCACTAYVLSQLAEAAKTQGLTVLLLCGMHVFMCVLYIRPVTVG